MPRDIFFPGRCYSGKRLPDDRLDLSVEIDVYHRNDARDYSRTTGVYHPSSLSPGACLRELYYDRMGVQPERSNYASELKLFALGHYIHNGLQAMLKEIFPQFQPEVHISLPSLHIEGHTDGVLDDWVVEIKSIGDASYKTLVRPKKEHLWQVHCYMAALDIPRAQVLYVNRNTGDMRLFRVRFQPEVWAQVAALIGTVERAVAAETPPEGINKSYVCRGCKFFRVCEPECLQTRS